MSEDGRTARARARAEEARARLGGTLGAIKQRVAPDRVAKEAMEGLVDRGAQALGSSIETARRHPLPLIGTAALLAAFLNRRRLIGLIRRGRAPKISAKPASTPRVRSREDRRPTPKRTKR